MCTYHSLNYNNDYSSLKAIHKTIKEPTYVPLKKIANQIKTNAGYVTLNLGGGRHGLQGLVLSHIDYSKISNIPYFKPTHLGALVIPASLPHYKAL